MPTTCSIACSSVRPCSCTRESQVRKSRACPSAASSVLSRWSSTPSSDAAGLAQKDGQQRRRQLYGALWVALEFQTWRALVRQQGFEDEEVIGLMVGMVRCLMRT